MDPHSIFLVEDHAGFANALNTMLSSERKSEDRRDGRNCGRGVGTTPGGESRPGAHRFFPAGYDRTKPPGTIAPGTSGFEMRDPFRSPSAAACPPSPGRGRARLFNQDNPLEILEGIQCILRGEYFVSSELRNTGSSDVLAGMA